MSDKIMPIEEKSISGNEIIVCRSSLSQGFWRGNQGFTRTIPFKKDGTPDWCAATDWSAPIPISILPGCGDIQAQSTFVYLNGKTLRQFIWRGNQGFIRTVPLQDKCTPDWNAASDWSAPISPSTLPGSGDIQSQNEYVSVQGRFLAQGFWRGNQGFTRTVPFKTDGTPDWDAASDWSAPIAPSILPGCGDIQAQSAFVSANGTILFQTVWQGNQGFTRTVPFKKDGTGTLNWDAASPWSAPFPTCHLPGCGDIQTFNEF
ncbi:MAG: hypothetical protein Fur006_69730 [Coleofasciculaceae cyanobacterium]